MSVREVVERTLERSWIEGERRGTPFAYTRPSPGHYPWQWYWDSCFTAIVWRRLDRARAAAELRTLLAAQREDGFIGHTVFWSRPVSVRRAFRYNVASLRAPSTATMQPPLLAWAWRIAVGDPAAEPRIAAHHRWLTSERDLDGDGLLWIVQPDESGLDTSPKFEPVWGRRAHGRPGFPLLIHRNRRLGWSARRILAAGGPVACEVVVNVLWGLARLAAGEPSITPRLVERLWDPDRGLFWDLARGEVEKGAPLHPAGGGDRRVAISTWSSLAPLALPDLPEEIGHRLVAEHLLDPESYWLPLAPPSVSAAEPSFEPRRWRFPVRRYWRGPSWVNSAWLVWIGLLRLGYRAQADRLAASWTRAVESEGLREFYEPRTGEGLGARDFGWSALALELAEPDPGAEGSYI